MRSLAFAVAGTVFAIAVTVGTASAQEPGRTYRIGGIWTGSSKPTWTIDPMEKWTGPGGAFRDTLRDNGFVLGKNLVVEYRHAKGDVSQLGAEAESLIASKVDVILSSGTAPTAAAMKGTHRVFRRWQSCPNRDCCKLG